LMRPLAKNDYRLVNPSSVGCHVEPVTCDILVPSVQS